jgi:hypothetical protein
MASFFAVYLRAAAGGYPSPMRIAPGREIRARSGRLTLWVAGGGVALAACTGLVAALTNPGRPAEEPADRLRVTAPPQPVAGQPKPHLIARGS